MGNNTTAGGSAPTKIFNVVSTRTVSASNVDASTGTVTDSPNLYYAADQNSGSKGTLTGLFEYIGTPTTSEGSNDGIRITPASGVINGTTVNFSPEGYFFANPTTLYIADTGLPKAGGNADGGIQKWSYSAANQVWTLDYTLKYNFGAGSDETGFESLAGQVVNGVVNLYATSYTSADDAPDGLYGVTDNLSFTTAAQASGEAVVQLAASLPDMDFKGVAVIPAATPTQPATDTPTLPQWGLILLAMALVLTGARQVPRKGASPDRRKLTRPRETSNAVWGSEPAQSPPHSPPGSLTRARSASA